MRISATLLLLSACAPTQEPAQDRGQGPDASFTDPAPPVVAELVPMQPLEARAYPELTQLAAPRPLAAAARTEDWPGFLGPRRDAKSRETELLADWPADGPNLVWSMERGQGYASPAIQGDRLVYTHRQGNETFIDCIEAQTGKRFWRFRYPTDYRGMYIPDGGPRATPQIEGDRVWVHGVQGMLHCLELSTGRVVWQRDLTKDFNLVEPFFGAVSAPLLYGDLLIHNLGAPGGPSVVAFDKNDGRVVWGTGSQWGMSCASPVVAPLHGEQRLFVVTGGRSRPPTGGLMVIDPQRGSTLAEFPFRSRVYESVNGTNPAVVGSTVVLTSAYNTGTVGVEIGPDGSVAQRWKVRRPALEFSAAVEVGGALYMVDGIRNRGGAIVCLDPATGEELDRTDIEWDEEVSFRGRPRTMGFGLGTGSLLHIGGDRFLCLTDNGHLLRLRCTPDGTEVLDRASLFHAPESWTPLVLSRGLLYVCQNVPERIGDDAPRLLCYDLRGR